MEEKGNKTSPDPHPVGGPGEDKARVGHEKEKSRRHKRCSKPHRDGGDEAKFRWSYSGTRTSAKGYERRCIRGWGWIS